jgi:hypothetical protein
MIEKRELLQTALRAVIFGAVAFGAVSAMAWTAAPASPPSNNVSAPINTSATAQTKAGTITINGAGNLQVLPTSNASWAGNIQSASLYGVYADNSKGIYGELANDIYSLYGNGNVYINSAQAGWAGYFSGANGVYGTNGTSWGALGYSSYGGYFNGTGGVYATNGAGASAYLAYPGNGTWGVYTANNMYANDFYIASVGRYASAGATFGSAVTINNSSAAMAYCPAGYFMRGFYGYAPGGGGPLLTNFSCQAII